MKCPACGTENKDGAKFCQECGAALGGGGASRVNRYVPPELMAKLEAARAGGGMQGERRIVTILFCDIKGSTAAAEKLDPEEWADIMNGAFERLIAPVYRYEGTLARLMGDAILAFFGAPIAHEDDPQRAILAGLAIAGEILPYRQKVERDWGIDFDVRVGINTGLVVVGEVGSDLRLEYTAMGDVVNLAARMEQTATPGTVRIAEATHKLVAPLFDFEQLGPVEVKGKQGPVRAYRVLGAKAQPGRLRGVEGLDSPMVGRARELAALRGQADALRRGSGSIVSVIAEAGLGKSRLVAELRKALEADGGLAHLGFHEGRTLSYQSSVPYAPIADLLRGMLDAGGYAAIRRGTADAVGEARADAVAPFLATLLGVAVEGEAAERVRYLEPPMLHMGIVGAVAELLAGAAAKKPLLLVFEDLHWADSSSLQVIERLLPLADQTSLMIVPVFRPRPQEPSWRLHEVAGRDQAHRYTPLMLEPLAEDDTRVLVANLLHVEGLTESVRAVILRKAEGNPFFVEEVIRSLIDQGIVVRDGEDWRATREIDGISIPGSLAAVLSARLDRLDETTRRTAQVAAVIGREFDFDALASLVEPLPKVQEALAELQRRGLVRERSRIPKRVYWFKHVMVQEAAYESLLLKTRREVHRQVGDVLARIDPDRSADIARHYLEARESERALPHLVTAAERAARAYSTPEALRLFDRAVEILEAGVSDVPLATRAYEGRGGARMLSMDIPGTMENWQAMIRWASGHGDEPMRISALNKLAMIHGMMLGNDQESRRLLDEAEAAAHGASCQTGIVEGCMVRCAVHLSKAEFDTAYKYLDQAAEIGRQLEAEAPLLFGMTHVANTLLFMTEYERCRKQIAETLAKAREFGNRKYECELKSFSLPSCLLREGDVAGAIAAAREGTEIAENIGDGGDLSVAAAMLGQIATLQARHEEAIALNEKAAAAARASGMPYYNSLALCTLGTSYVQVAERLHEKALEAHKAALEAMQMPSGSFFGALSWCELGFCAMEVGNLERARQMFEQGLTVPTAVILLFRTRLQAGAAMVAVAQGRLEDARKHAAEARATADRLDQRHEQPLVRWAEARVAAAAGERERARALYDETEALARPLGYRTIVWKAQAEAGKRAAARALVAEIAGEIGDAELRAGFVATAEKKLAAQPVLE